MIDKKNDVNKKTQINNNLTLCLGKTKLLVPQVNL